MADLVMENKVDENGGIETAEAAAGKGLKDRKFSWAKLRRVDSLNLEAGRVSNLLSHGSKVDWTTTLILAFQSVGVIFGDIGTSPLYVYSSTFPNGIDNTDDILGVLSLIIYTIVLIPMSKYVFIVLWANHNGNGGTFALYSLICRYAKVSLIPNQQPEDSELSNYKLDTPSNQMRRAQKVKKCLENSKVARTMLFLATILGVSMVIGDGILTPSISVLSAVSGIKQSAKSLNQDAVVGISVVILILLFSVQRFGTDKVGYSFAPIIILWFSFIGGIGVYNLFKHNVGVLRAFNPKYPIHYFQRKGHKAWISLGGVVLCITGTEAMFADLGHFSVRSVQISFSGMVFPSIICAYIGQAAYLTKFPDQVADTFYASIPDSIYWPMFVVAVCASIIASQAMISGAFAIITQSLTLGCFPRVKVVHTSTKYEGQVYIPELNYMIMIACVIVTISFRTTEKIGNAYGIAVVSVMVITTCLVSIIMLFIWKTNICWIVMFFFVFGGTEITYLSSVLYKFTQGGYLPVASSLVLMLIMGIWHYVHTRRYKFELKNKVSSEFVRDLAKNPEINRIPGVGLLYSELVQGIPPIFSHFIANIPSIHSVLVFVSIKSIPVSKVAMEERFLFRMVEPREYRMFKCVARYGYNDSISGPDEFELQLIENLKEFVRHENFILEGGGGGGSIEETSDVQQAEEASNSIPHSGILLVKDGKVDRGSGSPAVLSTEASVLHQSQAARVSSPSGGGGSIHPVNVVGGGRSTNSSSGLINGVRSTSSSSGIISLQRADEEMQFIQKAMEKGVVYLLGEAEVVAEENSSILKRIVVNHVYSFLRKNFRQGEKILAIPQGRLLRVGMTYEI